MVFQTVMYLVFAVSGLALGLLVGYTRGIEDSRRY